MENKDFKKRLENYIWGSELSMGDKGLWSIFAAIAPAEENEAVFEAVSESQENLEMLTKYLREKIFSMPNISEDNFARLVENKEQFGKFIEGLC